MKRKLKELETLVCNALRPESSSIIWVEIFRTNREVNSPFYALLSNREVTCTHCLHNHVALSFRSILIFKLNIIFLFGYFRNPQIENSWVAIFSRSIRLLQGPLNKINKLCRRPNNLKS